MKPLFNRERAPISQSLGLVAAGIVVSALLVGALAWLGALPERALGKSAVGLVVGVACFLVLRWGAKAGWGGKDDESLYSPEMSTLAFPPSTDSPRSKQSTAS